MTEIWELEANKITKLFKKKVFSAIEVVESVIKRYEKVNHKINAIPENTFEYAKKFASNLDKNLNQKKI